LFRKNLKWLNDKESSLQSYISYIVFGLVVCPEFDMPHVQKESD
jgi:hypothetical protein